MTPHAARDALAARDLWQGRRRRFDDDAEGFDATEATLDRVIELAGSTDLACHLVFEVERDYWQSRNRAAQVQKARQDRLGLGWANHDHHTFRCSRRFFPRVIGMFETLGFQLRERFHAGAHAGWGAQILEHPTTGHRDLRRPRPRPRGGRRTTSPTSRCPTCPGRTPSASGSACTASRSSRPGMHHLEAQFDFDALRDGLKAEAGIETMKPFSDFPFLRQAFTAGERWPVAHAPRRPAASRSAGSTPTSTPGSSARGRSAATSRTSSAARATRASTSRPSARSSRRPTRGCIEEILVLREDDPALATHRRCGLRPRHGVSRPRASW